MVRGGGGGMGGAWGRKHLALKTWQGGGGGGKKGTTCLQKFGLRVSDWCGFSLSINATNIGFGYQRGLHKHSVW